MSERKSTDKIAAAIHYLIARIPPHALGATKLNKILWFADCEFFSRHGRSLTGETHYLRRDNGPCIDRFDSIVAQLLLRGAITERVVKIIDYSRREFYPRAEPDVSLFSGEELDVLLRVASEIGPLSAEEASERSHRFLWECTPPNAQLSVAAGSVRGRPLDEKDKEWARSAFNERPAPADSI